jgi:hypothetical protein
MGKKHRGLFDQVYDLDALWRAYRKASAGKRGTIGYLLFRQQEAANLVLLSHEIRDGSYLPGPPQQFTVYEPKKRAISALPFRDRIVQHALVAAIEPIFERVFLPQSYACRPGKGTHRGAVAAQATMRRMLRTGPAWYLKIDWASYFASIDRSILHREIRRKISCNRTLALLELFHPPSGVGLPIGNLTSQLCANIYGHILDRLLVHTVHHKCFLRYMDDTVIFAHSREYLEVFRFHLKWFCETEMRLDFSRWSIAPVTRGLNFLGYRIWPSHKLLRPASVARAKKKIRRYRSCGDHAALERFLASWRGHAAWADSHNLLKHLGVAKCITTTP